VLSDSRQHINPNASTNRTSYSSIYPKHTDVESVSSMASSQHCIVAHPSHAAPINYPPPGALASTFGSSSNYAFTSNTSVYIRPNGPYPPYQASNYPSQRTQQRILGFGDDLRRHEGEDNNNDMKNGNKVGNHLIASDSVNESRTTYGVPIYPNQAIWLTPHKSNEEKLNGEESEDEEDGDKGYE
jgi:hypothetical protein